MNPPGILPTGNDDDDKEKDPGSVKRSEPTRRASAQCATARFTPDGAQEAPPEARTTLAVPGRRGPRTVAAGHVSQ
jgi:hypothetical protein